jgi:hypothetical protein
MSLNNERNNEIRISTSRACLLIRFCCSSFIFSASLTEESRSKEKEENQLAAAIETEGQEQGEIV